MRHLRNLTIVGGALALVALGCSSPERSPQVMVSGGMATAGVPAMPTSGVGGAAGAGADGGGAASGAGAASGGGSGGAGSGGAGGSSGSAMNDGGMGGASGGESMCTEAACDGIACGMSPFCPQHCGTCTDGNVCMDGQCVPQEDCGKLMVEFETVGSCALDVAAEQELDGEGFIDADGVPQRLLALDRWGSGHVMAWCDSSTLFRLLESVNVRHYLGRSDSARVASFGDDFMCNPNSVSAYPLPQYVTYFGLGLPAEYRDDPAALAADWDAIIYCGYRAEWDDAWVPTLQAYVSEHGKGLLAALDYAGFDAMPEDFAHANAIVAPTGITFLELVFYQETAAVSVDGEQCVPDLVVY